ncbi:MAG TPA: TMEM175 family protein [Kineosporiaceae bacterium]|nr:TMEM175 family protein [Kineosporiaceae bacterium]
MLPISPEPSDSVEQPAASAPVGTAESALVGSAVETAALNEDGLHAPHRLFALADGVFAISMTLLALDVRIPEKVPDTQAGFVAASGEFYGRFGVFVVAFLIAGRFWVSNHRIMAELRSVDSGGLERTVLFLAGVSSLPVATAVLFRFGDVPHAVTFASVLLAVTTLLSARLWWYVSDPARHLSETTAEVRNATMLQLLFTTIVFLLAIPIAYLLPQSETDSRAAWATLTWLLLIFDNQFSGLVVRLHARFAGTRFALE